MLPLLGTVLLDPPMTLLVGGLIALVSARLIARAGLTEVWRAGLLAAAWGFAWSLSAAWCFFYRTDWMLAYLVDGARLPLWPTFGLFTAVCTGFSLLGALGVGVLIHLTRRALAWLATVSAALAYLGCRALTLGPTEVVGTRAQYLAGQAPKLVDDALMSRALDLSGGAVAVVSVAVLAVQVRRLKRVPRP